MYLLLSSVEIVSSDYTQYVTFYSVLEHVLIKEKSLHWGALWENTSVCICGECYL